MNYATVLILAAFAVSCASLGPNQQYHGAANLDALAQAHSLIQDYRQTNPNFRSLDAEVQASGGYALHIVQFRPGSGFDFDGYVITRARPSNGFLIKHFTSEFGVDHWQSIENSDLSRLIVEVLNNPIDLNNADLMSSDAQIVYLAQRLPNGEISESAVVNPMAINLYTNNTDNLELRNPVSEIETMKISTLNDIIIELSAATELQ
ncbi:hypothetical protein [Parasphingopyxis lamellibrachiae]|uniref:Outer membrane lipoprotein-sorting protein n=1 Tax=Parasphingopyxis lamellibrachiae TaxID=680125 RepID=A0A3D9FAH7_9SPHN|nr:hypothetical protein [Parasphingopyxis lamellibrachiae]RED12666.1 hypothetical protein DFR46_2910 [Parasphingopyxis lamellibrachiae]